MGDLWDKVLFLPPLRRGVRVVEGARLESVYTPKGYRGFESHSLRRCCHQKLIKACKSDDFRLFYFTVNTKICKYSLFKREYIESI